MHILYEINRAFERRFSIFYKIKTGSPVVDRVMIDHVQREISFYKNAFSLSTHCSSTRSRNIRRSLRCTFY